MFYHRLRSARQKGERIGIVPFRLLAYLLHATGMERFYKPRYIRHKALFELTDEVINQLPRYSQSMTGAVMDPINLIFVGQERDIKRAFKKAGWHGAHPANPIFILLGLLSGPTKRTYSNGPFSPHFVNIGLQDMGFQKLTKKQNFSQRHHIRIWKSGIVLSENKRVWIAAASYDIKLKIQLSPPFIHHEIDPNLDTEREFITTDLQKSGATRLKSVHMNNPIYAADPAANATGANYFTDGRAVVIEL